MVGYLRASLRDLGKPGISDFRIEGEAPLDLGFEIWDLGPDTLGDRWEEWELGELW